MTEGERVFQVLLSEHKGNAGAALRDLAERFAYISQFVSPGFGRWAMNDVGADPKLDVPANPITDEWIRTGVDA